ncbi:MAG: hypothetical protein KY469_07730 [Actinobacteria bacterium]|nr:hypothetical protein [Actinomycetota bacterium]
MRLRRAATGVAMLGVLASGCGGEDTTAASCPELADEVIATVQDLVDQVSSEAPEVDFEGLDGRMEDFRRQAEDLGCSDDEMERLVLERVDDIEVEGPLGAGPARAAPGHHRRDDGLSGALPGDPPSPRAAAVTATRLGQPTRPSHGMPDRIAASRSYSS